MFACIAAKFSGDTGAELFRPCLPWVGVVALIAEAPVALAGPVYSASAAPGGLFQNGDDAVSAAPSRRRDGKRPRRTDVAAAAGHGDRYIQTVQVYCTDIFDYLNLPATFTRGLLSDTVTRRDEAFADQCADGQRQCRRQFRRYVGGLADGDLEIENETSGHYDVSAGAFTASGPSNAVALANQDIQNVLNGVWKADRISRSISSRHRATSRCPMPRPFPSRRPLAIFGTGLVLMIVLRRSRRLGRQAPSAPPDRIPRRRPPFGALRALERSKTPCVRSGKPSRLQSPRSGPHDNVMRLRPCRRLDVARCMPQTHRQQEKEGVMARIEQGAKNKQFDGQELVLRGAR